MRAFYRSIDPSLTTKMFPNGFGMCFTDRRPPLAALQSKYSVMASLSRRACYKCGNVGHYAEVCSSSERLCYNCESHRLRLPIGSGRQSTNKLYHHRQAARYAHEPHPHRSLCELPPCHHVYSHTQSLLQAMSPTPARSHVRPKVSISTFGHS